MEPEEIAVVLSRASELHSRLSDAINLCVEDSPSHSPRIAGLQNEDGSLELRSLGAIRNSLEVLEEQLEALQTLQQQQRADRDAGLADIEESRRLFLKLLKEYRGKELEIVQEALGFAGDNVPHKGALSTQGYPSTVDGDFSRSPLILIPRGRYDSVERQELHEVHRSRNQLLRFDLEEPQEDDGRDDDSCFEDEGNPIGATARSLNAMKNGMISSRAFTLASNAIRNSLAFLSRFLGQISGQVSGPPSKAMLISISTLVLLSLTDLGERRAKSVARLSRRPAHQSHQYHMHNLNAERGLSSKSSNHDRKSEPPNGRANFSAEGYRFGAEDPINLADAFPNCVVRERIELPFYQELQMADALHGRG